MTSKFIYTFILCFIGFVAIGQQINGPTSVTPGTTHEYSYSSLPQGGDTFSWSVSGGGTLGPIKFVTPWKRDVTWTGNGTVTLTVTNGGSSNTYTKNVSACSTPSAPTVPNRSACGNSVTLTISGASGTYQWFHNNSTSGLPISNGTVSGVTYSLGIGGHSLTMSNYTGSETVYVRKTSSCGNSGLTASTGTVTANPTKYNMSGGGSYCSGDGGVAVGLVGSQSGVAYQLKRNGSNVGSTVSGTGSAISFGNQTTAGTYTVQATNGGGCASTMNGSKTVTVNPLPTVYSMTGGGSYCSGDGGVSVGLNGSQSGVNYQLKRNGSNIGSAVSGTGSSITFGSQTQAGTYTVVAINASTNCDRNMSGSKTVIVNSEPTLASGSNQSRCGTGVISLSATPGSHANSIRWYSASSGGSLLSTGTSYGPTVSTSTTYYAASYNTTTGCEDDDRHAIVATVVPPTVGGAVSGTTEEFGIASGTLTLSGQTGSVVKWQYRTTGNWVDTLVTNTTLGYTNLRETREFRAVVESGTCGEEESSTATVTILQEPTVDLGIMTDVRPGLGTTISADASHSNYQWFRNNIEVQNGASNELVVNLPGTYKVTVTSGGGATHTTGDAIIGSQVDMNENAVVSYTYRTPVQYINITNDTIDFDPFNYAIDEQSISAQVFDGLGRQTQQVALFSSPQEKDIVVPVAYDELGRQTKSYLPFVANDLATVNKPNALAANYVLSDHYEFYHNTPDSVTNAYSETRFEASPLNRPLEQGAPGDSWQIGQNTVKFQYDVADSAEVIKWEFETLLTSAKMVYLVGDLAENTTIDEDGNQMVEYTNKQGQTILKKAQIDGSTWAETYYLYDIYGQLAAVLPPEAAAQLNTGFFGQNEQTRKAFLNTWAFLYDYDGRKRMTMKKVPGADSVFMVYDKWDRLVLTQDGNQRANNKWLFTKYDELNRPIVTGLMTGGSESVERTAVAASTARFDTLNTTLTNEYSNQTYPTTGIDEYLTVTYYDNYDWDNSGLTFTNPAGLTHITAVKGLVTGTLTKTGNGSWIRSASYYDDRYRVIQTQSTNHLGGTDVVTNYYDFIGQVTESISTHDNGTDVYTTARKFEYDHTGRLLTTIHFLTQDVQWRDVVGVTVDGNTLTKNVSAGWGNSGAASVLQLEAGQDGYFEFEVEDNSLFVGFSDSNPDATQNTIDYAVYLRKVSSDIRAYANGSSLSNLGAYSVGDVVRLERTNGVITIKKNGTTLYTWSGTSTGSLLIDASLHDADAVLKNVKFAKGQILAQNTYNERGELIEKDLHEGAGGAFAQSLDYTYNIRGWLTSMNDSDLSTSADGDLFGFNLLYDQADGSLSNTQLYNGNISAMKWSNHDAAEGTVDERAYNFGYDKLNRLKTASHYQDNVATNKYGVQGLNYDRNGNITSLQRRAQSTSVYMDDLSYTYTGNQLQKVSDAATDTTGFYDGYTGSIDYVYDANGNMVKDRNKKIDSIYYNHLNLPILVDFETSGDSIAYLYDAAGIKLQQKVWRDDTLRKTTDYVGEFIYETDTSGVRTLQLVQHEEGRLTPELEAKLLTPVDTAAIELTLTLDGNANDTSGNGRNGTVNGATLTAGHDDTANSAYTFDGVDDYIDLGSHASYFTGLAEGTISMWFKADSGNNIGTVVSTGSSLGEHFSIMIGGNMSGTASNESIMIQHRSGGWNILSFATNGDYHYNDDTWHHLTYTVNSGGNTLYIDGVQLTLTYVYGSASTSGEFLNVSSSGMALGKRSISGSEEFFEGDVDEFNVFSRVLTQAEISRLANGTNPGEQVTVMNPVAYDYQYHLKDHLGNVRLTFSTTPENYTMVETFETGEDNGWQDLHRHTSASANTTVGGDEVERLQSGQTGAMIFVNVNKGDTLDLSVQANYESAPTNNNFLGTGYTALFNSFDNVYGSGVENGVTTTSTVFDDALSGTEMGGKGNTSSAPRAFLNYIVFDKDMSYVTAGFQQISTSALGVGVHETISINDILPEQDGYILAYLSNENQEAVNIHWDDFTVYHGKTNVVSTQDYYPFGLTFNESQRVASKKNRFLYNQGTGDKQFRTERVKVLGVNWDMTKLRTYDYTTGRFMQVDPLADAAGQEIITPYQYAYNNPALYNDPYGDCPPWNPNCGDVTVGGGGKGPREVINDVVEGVVDFFSNLFSGDEEKQGEALNDLADVTPGMTTVGLMAKQANGEELTGVEYLQMTGDMASLALIVHGASGSGSTKPVADTPVSSPKPTMKGPKPKGSNNPVVKEAAANGRAAHKQFAAQVKAKKGWTSEPSLKDPATGKRVKPDALTRSGAPVELKPNTASGRAKGATQIKKYERATGQRGRVIYYDASRNYRVKK